MGEEPDGSRKIHARVGLPKSTSPRGENCRLLRDRLPIPLQSASGWASTEAGAIPKRRFGLIHRNPGSGEENRAASSQETWPIRRRRYDLRGGRIGDLPERASAPPWPVLSRPRARSRRPARTGQEGRPATATIYPVHPRSSRPVSPAPHPTAARTAVRPGGRHGALTELRGRARSGGRHCDARSRIRQCTRSVRLGPRCGAASCARGRRCR